jgi:hypothetical protein
MKRLAIAIAMVAATGCGKKDKEENKGKQPDVPPKVVTPQVDLPVVKEEKPPAPKEMLVGKARVINLYVDAAGKGQEVDVWMRRSFKYGPVLIKEKLGLGQATDFFGAVPEQTVVIVPTGAGSDAKELAGAMKGKGDEVWTTVLAWNGTGMSGASTQDAPPDMGEKGVWPPKPPAAGKGLVVLRADALQEHEKALTEQYGGRSFMVGDGKGACMKQRLEDVGFSASVLGGTQPVILELAPGKHAITFHKWPGKCDTPAVYQVEVDVAADKSTLVHLFTRDAKTLDNLQLPM